ncbi:MAG: potassium channel family protein [bacterium]
MNIIIAGGREASFYLARNLISKGYEVTLINKDRDFCEKIAPRLNALIVHGNASYPMVLEDANAYKADTIVALTGRDYDNLAICQLASKQFSVSRTMARINNPANKELFKKLGVNTVFNTTGLVSSMVEQHVAIEEITNLMTLESGKVNITEVIIPEDSPALDTPLQDLNLPQNSVLGCLIRHGEVQLPYGQTVFEPGDRVLVIALPESQGEVMSRLVGEDA